MEEKMRFVTIALLVLCPLAVAHADADPKTQRLWKAKCASCHGEDGKAQTDQGKKMKVADMTAAAWQKKFDDAALKKAITDGVKREEGGVKKEMEPYGPKLKPEQVDALVAYVRGLGK
jgi:mono/diheme cytochrome c family protein